MLLGALPWPHNGAYTHPCMTTWEKLSQKFLLFEQQASFFPLDTHVTVDVSVSVSAAQNSDRFVSSKCTESGNSHSCLHPFTHTPFALVAPSTYPSIKFILLYLRFKCNLP